MNFFEIRPLVCGHCSDIKSEERSLAASSRLLEKKYSLGDGSMPHSYPHDNQFDSAIDNYRLEAQRQEPWMHDVLFRVNSQAQIHDPRHLELQYPHMLLLLRVQDEKCACCGTTLFPDGPVDSDNLPMVMKPCIPYAKGGCNCLNRMMILCPRCADKMGNKSVDYLQAKRGQLIIRADELAMAMISQVMGHEEHLKVGT